VFGGRPLAQQKLNVKFYEDFPMSHERRARWRRGKLTSRWIRVSRDLAPARALQEEASLQYRSQIPANFGTEDRPVADDV
jgi:hypothetical protein